MSESRTVVYGAIAGNLAIAATKFVVAALTGSAAMMSEAIHSTVDTGNEVLLLIGLRLSERKADPEHPFGHGKDLYFWSLIVAVLIFGIGGGVSLFEGARHVMHPQPIEDPFWSYVVLGVSAVLEGASFSVAFHTVWQKKGKRSLLQALHRSKDPSVFTVFAEDAAALVGLAIAAFGIYGSTSLGMPVLDGLASIAIGLVLVIVASLLIYESRGLLIGEGVSKETAEEIRRLVGSDEDVASVAYPLTMYFGPDDVLLTLDVQFKSRITGVDVANTVDHLERRIRERFPVIKHIYIEARQIAATAANAHLLPAGLHAGRPAR